MSSKKISLVIVPLLLSACSGSKTLEQDVYNNQYDCMRDWNTELCEEEQSSGSSGYYAGVSRYIGPQYYSGNRKVKYKGRLIAPNSKHSSSQPMVSQVVKTNAKSQPVRGGFGRGGSSFGG